MNVRLVPLAVLLLASGFVFADPPAHTAGAGRNMDDLAVLLDLNDGQKAAVQKVLEEQRTQMSSLRDQGRQSGQRPTQEQMQEMHAKHDQMRQETLEKLKPILNEQQLKKFEILSNGPPPGMGHGMRPHRQPNGQASNPSGDPSR